MCGDTGVPRWYVKYGNDARVEGGPIAVEAALRRATARATQDTYGKRKSTPVSTTFAE